MAEVAGQADKFESRVVGVFEDAGIVQGSQEVGWQRFTGSQVNGDQRVIIEAVGQQEDLEIRGLDVAVDAALWKVLGGEGLNIDM